MRAWIRGSAAWTSSRPRTMFAIACSSEPPAALAELVLEALRSPVPRIRRNAARLAGHYLSAETVALEDELAPMRGGGIWRRRDARTTDGSSLRTLIEDPTVEVVAFTATQIPGIDDRTYPKALAGPLYPDGIPIVPEAELERVIRRRRVAEVVFAYSAVSHEQVMHTASGVLAAGADFIKTSTGKVSPAATLPVTLVMLETIREHWNRTGKVVGMKPAGGIRTAKEAIQYLVVVHETLGPDWLTPERFRFGASSLVNDLLMQLEKEATGAYADPDDFTID